MKRSLFVFLLILLSSLAACRLNAAEDPLAIVDEPGVVTVFKTPT